VAVLEARCRGARFRDLVRAGSPVLRFGPSIPVSAYAVVIVILGLLVLVALVSELLSWLLFAKSLAHLLGRDKGDRKRLP
jgi:hypothetical protein